MAQLQNYWRIIPPASRKQLYTTVTTDAYDPRTTDLSSLSTVTWYSQVMRGLGNRFASYKQYDAMDADIDIARSLDIIAEEMSGKDEKTDLPFEIVYQKEDNEEISDTTAITLRQAVRQWANTQDFNKRIFSIARCMIKYGDCFFRKLSDTKKWIYVDPSLVYGIEVDQFGAVVNYHVKKIGGGNTAGTFGTKTEQHEIVPAAAMIHFTLSDDMGDSAPFGSSVLRPIHRVFKQLTMLEDAVVIYKIVRAPERRVFYIDTGNMPPQKIKQYLEQIKNEVKQKRTPGVAGGKDVVDGQFDPTSIQEDMYFPVSASGRGSRVETLPGGAEDFGTGLLKVFQDKIFRGLRIPTSYMSGTEGAGAQYNDGKVGIAYIEELRFAQFIRRMQDRMEEIFDQEFKVYLKVLGLKIDDEIFKIKLPDPANFALYRQAALDADLISSYNNIAADKTLSRRFILKRYLGLTDDEIQMNEVMIKEERNITDNNKIPALVQMYDPAIYDNRETISVEPDEPESSGGEIGGGDEEDDVNNGFFSGGDANEPADEAPAADNTTSAA
jgi:hypothetical protein